MVCVGFALQSAWLGNCSRKTANINLVVHFPLRLIRRLPSFNRTNCRHLIGRAALNISSMPSAQATPSSIAGFIVLTLSLPPLPSFPVPASHYLYLAPHEPKIPTPTAARSLFLVNVPFDATKAHIKHLFSTQLGLSQGRIEDVHFEADKKQAIAEDGSSTNPPSHERRGKKRKRIFTSGPIEDEEGAGLPTTWDRKLQPMGGTATVLFVDRASMEAVLKEARKKRKEGDGIPWTCEVEEKLPKLGSSRKPSVRREIPS